MDPPRPSLLKKRRRKGGALGRHAGGRKKKRQGSQTLVASFPGTSVTAASTVTIDQSLDCNVDNKDTVKPSDLPFIKHLRNRANYAERKCGTKTEQIKDLKASELVLKLAQINAQEVHDASIKQTQMEMAQTLKQSQKEMAQTLKQSQKEMAQTLKQSQKVQNQLEKQLDKNETSANKVELQLEKKLLSSEASSFKVAKTLSTRAVRFATALSEEKEKNKVLKSSIKSIKSAIKSTAQTHKVTIQAQQRTIQAQQRTHKTKLNSEVEQVREEFSSVIRKTQVEFDEATVNAKGKARRHGDSVKTKAEAKVSRSQRTCAGLRGKLKVRTQLYYISFPCLKSASLSLY
jgi:hypothetical protein